MRISSTSYQPVAAAGQAPTRTLAESQDANPIDRLPDLSTIEARATEDASQGSPVAEAKTGISGAKKAALVALGLGSAFMAASPAQAHGYGRGYGGYGYGGGGGYYRNYNYGYNNGGNAGAIIGGMIIGGIIGGMTQQAPPVYYPPQPVYRTPFYNNYNQLVCPSGNGGWYMSPDNVRCW